MSAHKSNEGRTAMENTKRRHQLSYERATSDPREQIGSTSLSLIKIFLLSIAVIISSMVLPLSLTSSKAATPLAWISCLISGVLIVYTSKKFVSLILLLIAYSFAFYNTGSPVLISITVGTVVACGVYSAICASASLSRIPLIAATPVVLYALTCIITKDPLISLLSLISILPALAMGISTRKKAGPTLTIALFAAVAVVEICIGVLTHIFIENGGLSLKILEEAAKYFHKETAQFIRSVVESANASAITGEIEIQINALATEITNALAGFIAFSAISVGFFSQKVQSSLFAAFELEELQNTAAAPIKASVASALLFTAAHIFSYTSNATDSTSFIAVAALNISLVFMPIMLYVGYEALTSLPKKIGFLAIAAWIGVVLLSAVLSSSVVILLALTGVFYTIFVHVDTWAKEHYSKGEDI